MKVFLSILLCFILHDCVYAQSVPGKTGATTLINARSIPVQQENAGTALQAQGWKQQAQQHPSDADAWYNYYQWQSRNNAVSLQEKNDIVQQASKYISGSWQISMMAFLQSGLKDTASLFNAIRLTTDAAQLYPYAVQAALVLGDNAMRLKYTGAAAQSLSFSKTLYAYHFNTLMSADSNAIIYAKGLGDLVPLAIMQDIYGIRMDIQLKCYNNNVLPGDHVYLCISLGKEILAQYPNSVYTGLLVRLVPGTSNELATHAQADFSLSDLQTATSLNPQEQLIFRNYLPAFIILYKQLEKDEVAKAAEWRSLIMHIALLTGTTPAVQQALEKR